MNGNQFGLMVAGIDLAHAVKRTLVAWTPDYIAEVSERSGRARGALSPFRSYSIVADEDTFAEEQIPACYIIIPDVPRTRRKARGEYDAEFDLRVGFACGGNGADNTLENAMLYALAIRAIGTQQGGWSGDPRIPEHERFATSTVWEGERYDLLDTDEKRRRLGIGAVLFTVAVSGVIQSDQGPSEPTGVPAVDPGPWPTEDPDKINIAIEHQEI